MELLLKILSNSKTLYFFSFEKKIKLFGYLKNATAPSGFSFSTGDTLLHT